MRLRRGDEPSEQRLPCLASPAAIDQAQRAASDGLDERAVRVGWQSQRYEAIQSRDSCELVNGNRSASTLDGAKHQRLRRRSVQRAEHLGNRLDRAAMNRGDAARRQVVVDRPYHGSAVLAADRVSGHQDRPSMVGANVVYGHLAAAGDCVQKDRGARQRARRGSTAAAPSLAALPCFEARRLADEAVVDEACDATVMQAEESIAPDRPSNLIRCAARARREDRDRSSSRQIDGAMLFLDAPGEDESVREQLHCAASRNWRWCKTSARANYVDSGRARFAAVQILQG